MSALSVPLRNSLRSFPVSASHTLTSVPREDVVASRRPEGGKAKVVNAVVWATMIVTGCFVGGGGGFRGGEAGGGSLEIGGLQGGRCTNWTWPS